MLTNSRKLDCGAKTFFIIIVALISLLSCSSVEQESPQSSTQSVSHLAEQTLIFADDVERSLYNPDSDFVLDIDKINETHISGRFGNGDYGIAFTANQAERIVVDEVAIFVSIASLNEIELVESIVTTSIAETTFLNGEYKISTKRVENMIFGDGTELDVIESGGFEETFSKLASIPEFQLLPLLSKSLGEANITGNAHPISLPIHQIARGSYQVFNDDIIQDAVEIDSSQLLTGRVLVNLAEDNRQLFLEMGSNSGTGPNDTDTKGSDDVNVVYMIKNLDSAREYYKGLYAVLGYGGLDFGFGDANCMGHIDPDAYSQCMDDFLNPPSTCAETPDSNNGCYGMCGNGCDCWEWVCGDCCVHAGCKTHDNWCRSCSILNPTSCALCYGPFAGVGLNCGSY